MTLLWIGAIKINLTWFLSRFLLVTELCESKVDLKFWKLVIALITFTFKYGVLADKALNVGWTFHFENLIHFNINKKRIKWEMSACCEWLEQSHGASRWWLLVLKMQNQWCGPLNPSIMNGIFLLLWQRYPLYLTNADEWSLTLSEYIWAHESCINMEQSKSIL